MKDKVILITSNEEWGDVWYSKHNYAYEFSKSNKVVFINPVGRWKVKNLLRFNFSLVKISENLSVLNYTNYLPIRFKFLFLLNDYLVSKSISKKLKKNNFKSELFISFDPYRLANPRLLKVNKIVFICVDDFNFKHMGEEILCSNVDYIITISAVLSSKYIHFKKPILTISHGISSEEFTASKSFFELKEFGLYIGSIDKRIDFKILKAIIDKFKNIPFVFIGFLRIDTIPLAQEIFTNYKNVHYLGHKPFKELKNYIAASKFCLAPMNINEPGNDISHHKIFQYLAFGKPVFSTKFKEYLFIQELLYMENDINKLIDKMRDFVKFGEEPTIVIDRINFAKTKTYDKLISQIETFIDEK